MQNGESSQKSYRSVTMPNTEYEDKLTAHFKPLVDKHGDSHKSVNWGSETSQNLRFSQLLSFGPKKGESILDLGCGVGHLYKYTKTNHPGILYSGIDLVEEMIKQAQKSYPEGNFEHCDITQKFRNQEFDITVASGIFYLGCDYERMFRQIKSMWLATRRVIAFNSLSSWAEAKEAGEFYADPLKVLEFCKTLSPRVVLLHQYLPHDFTIQVFRHSYEGAE